MVIAVSVDCNGMLTLSILRVLSEHDKSNTEPTTNCRAENIYLDIISKLINAAATMINECNNFFIFRE